MEKDIANKLFLKRKEYLESGEAEVIHQVILANKTETKALKNKDIVLYLKAMHIWSEAGFTAKANWIQAIAAEIKKAQG